MAKVKINTSQLQFHYVETRQGTGVWALYAFYEGWSVPIGTVYYRHSWGNALEMLDSFVITAARRQGVRTAMHNELIRGYPSITSIVTETGNKKSTPWMLKNGYKQTSKGWKCKIKRKA